MKSIKKGKSVVRNLLVIVSDTTERAVRQLSEYNLLFVKMNYKETVIIEYRVSTGHGIAGKLRFLKVGHGSHGKSRIFIGKN